MMESMKFSSSSSPPSFFFFLRHGIGKCPRAMRLKMLQARLTKAVISIISELICSSPWWFTILSVASKQSHMIMTQMMKILARAPRTSAL